MTSWVLTLEVAVVVCSLFGWVAVNSELKIVYLLLFL